MNEIEIPLPQNFIFQLDLPIRIYDINYGNHLGHDSLISLLHETRVSFLKKHNLTEVNVNFGLILSSLNILYKNQAFYGQTLTIGLGVSDITKFSFNFLYLISEKSKEIARASTKMVCFDYQKQRIRKVTDEFLNIITPK